ncbi:MAG: AAA family ATPase [Deltaproteobacteria bacterium]|nr:MAG: AAA family ATPase [Deltaproteobacteria bacterium]
MHLSRPLEMSLSLALREARGRRHEFLTVEHVLYALLHDEAVAEVVRACGGDVDALKQELATYLDERLERLPPDSEASPERTLGFQRILQRAAAHVQSSGKEELDGRHVLVAIFRETDSHAAYLLAKQGITRLDVVTYLSHGIAKAPEPAPQPEEEDDEEGPRSARDPLAAFTVNLVERAAAGHIDPLIGQARLKAVIGALRAQPGAILFIDEIHTVVGAGAVQGGSLDASNILKPALAGGEIRCIGATTYHDYRSHFEKDRAFARRFQKIEVSEPSVEETHAILRGLKSHYETHHGVTYTDRALRAAAELAAKHVHDRFLPDKAIDVIDEAGAALQVSLRARPKKTVRTRDIEQVIATMAKIPPRTVSLSDRDRLQTLDRDMKLVVFGQDPAIDAVVASIRLARAGLRQPDKPVGSFLFAGPTGVGKTEVAKQLAAALGVEFLRFDMSEFMEKHTVSRLIGAPPGYVGFDQGGLLTDAIRRTPHNVLLLDEIEKAHPDLFNILLQVMDHATLTDHTGRQADFRHAILIMTTNAGAQEMAAAAIGFGEPTNRDKGRKALERLFSPEFRNRLDAVVTFASLTPEAVERVVDKFVTALEAQLVGRRVTQELTPAARRWLAERGYDEAFGARPMARLIEQRITKVLADEMLFGRLRDGGRAEIDADGEQLSFRYVPLGAPAPAAPA